MAALGVSLGTIGISQATGYQLIAQREQLAATLPRDAGAASGAAKSADSTAATTAGSDGSTTKTSNKSAPAPGSGQLTPQQQRAVQELRQIDRAVRAHEQAHIAAGQGVVTSGPNYTYTYGPDGKQYAVGGEVGIDTSAEGKPQANIDKGRLIQAAALAPRDPSPQDYRVATIGSQLEAQGRTDLRRQALQTESASNSSRQQVARAYSAGSSAVGDNPTPSATLSVFA